MSHYGLHNHIIIYHTGNWIDRVREIFAQLEYLGKEYARLAQLKASILASWL